MNKTAARLTAMDRQEPSIMPVTTVSGLISFARLFPVGRASPANFGDYALD